MGDIADYYTDYGIDSEDIERIKSKKQLTCSDYIWLTSSNEEIEVRNMTTNHVKNTLRCLQEGRIKFDSPYEVYKWIHIFNDELKLRKS